MNQPSRRYEPFSVRPAAELEVHLQPGDVLLVEGNRRISSIIKYLTQSTWSHAALYVGPVLGETDQGEAKVLIEARSKEGVHGVPLSTYGKFNTRICRPVHLSEEDREALIQDVISRLGHQYDMRNLIDLFRYLVPRPPVPVRFRRRMLAFGSGEPTRVICSTLIAKAFQGIKYPILPRIEEVDTPEDTFASKEILHIRHHSLFTPRDFDISPYFEIVKPALDENFDYQKLEWQ